MKQLTQARLKERLHYDPVTGIFTWKEVRYSNSLANTLINARDVGRRAGTNLKGYVNIWLDGRGYGAQRLAFLYMTGRWPVEQVDHINRNRSDNRWCNLREVTLRENLLNKSVYSNNTSGIPGVNWHKRDKKWYVRINTAAGRKHVGAYESIEEATAARKQAEKKYGYLLV
jgi:hypothetical protein